MPDKNETSKKVSPKILQKIIQKIPKMLFLKYVEKTTKGNSSRIQICKTNKQNWRYYQEIRLKSLKEEPWAIKGSLEEEEKLSEEDWIKKSENPYTFVAIDLKNNTPVGTISAYEKVEDGQKNLYFSAFFVSQKYRGRGVGGKLINQLAAHLFQIPKFDGYYLWVKASQKEAISIYQKYGFEICDEVVASFGEKLEYKKYRMKLQKINFLQFHPNPPQS